MNVDIWNAHVMVSSIRYGTEFWCFDFEFCYLIGIHNAESRQKKMFLKNQNFNFTEYTNTAIKQEQSRKNTSEYLFNVHTNTV